MNYYKKIKKSINNREVSNLYFDLYYGWDDSEEGKAGKAYVRKFENKHSILFSLFFGKNYSISLLILRVLKRNLKKEGFEIPKLNSNWDQVGNDPFSFI
jgi:hypothetical protein